VAVVDKNLLELWGQTLLGMAKIAEGPQGFFDLFQDGFAKREQKQDSMHKQFMELCQNMFGKEGIERFNEIMKEFYENAGVVPRTKYNELYKQYVDLKEKVRELEEKIERLKKRFEAGGDTSGDVMAQWTEMVKKYAEVNQRFFEEFSKFFKA
jgi:chromosome segregation ATPase